MKQKKNLMLKKLLKPITKRNRKNKIKQSLELKNN